MFDVASVHFKADGSASYCSGILLKELRKTTKTQQAPSSEAGGTWGRKRYIGEGNSEFCLQSISFILVELFNIP
jgi:hypothetical protein